MDIDEIMADSYKHCISRQMPLSEELIEWFDAKVQNLAGQEDVTMANAKLHVVSDLGLSYSPQRWHEILESERVASA